MQIKSVCDVLDLLMHQITKLPITIYAPRRLSGFDCEFDTKNQHVDAVLVPQLILPESFFRDVKSNVTKRIRYIPFLIHWSIDGSVVPSITSKSTCTHTCTSDGRLLGFWADSLHFA